MDHVLLARRCCDRIHINNLISVNLWCCSKLNMLADASCGLKWSPLLCDFLRCGLFQRTLIPRCLRQSGWEARPLDDLPTYPRSVLDLPLAVPDLFLAVTNLLFALIHCEVVVTLF